MQIPLRLYVVSSLSALASVMGYAFLVFEDFYSMWAFVWAEKLPSMVVRNFFLMIFICLCRLIAFVFFGRLRDIEIETLIETIRMFVMDTLLFLLLSRPTVGGTEVHTMTTINIIALVVAVKIFHTITANRLAHMFEVGQTDTWTLGRFSVFCTALLCFDTSTIVGLFRVASFKSTMYIWILFEMLTMLVSHLSCIAKFGVLLLDLRPKGFSYKNPTTFFLDLLTDIVSLFLFMMFVLMFFITHPSRLPLYMTGDIVQVTRALYLKIRSLKRYRELSRCLETRFDEPTAEELASAETCIICRENLEEGCRKLGCGHIFHVECLRSWFVHQQACPTCRQEVQVNKPEDKPDEDIVPSSAEPVRESRKRDVPLKEEDKESIIEQDATIANLMVRSRQKVFDSLSELAGLESDKAAMVRCHLEHLLKVTLPVGE